MAYQAHAPIWPIRNMYGTLMFYWPDYSKVERDEIIKDLKELKLKVAIDNFQKWQNDPGFE